MPAWPGGPCPQCGEDVPPRIIRCRSCRCLLNPELQPEAIVTPEFVPLPIIETVVELNFEGYYIDCPGCQKELRIHRKYQGQIVSCKHCQSNFCFDLTNPALRNHSVYSDCPHCQKSLKFAPKYLGLKVACRHCDGRLMLLPSESEKESATDSEPLTRSPGHHMPHKHQWQATR